MSRENSASSVRESWLRSSWMAAVLLSACLFCPLEVTAESTWPSFDALSLMGRPVSSDQLTGQPTLLIITPSRDAAAATRRWVEALRGKIEPSDYRLLDVLAINLPFFISPQEALDNARKKIPPPYHDQTWLLDSKQLERELGIPPTSHKAAIVVLDQEGRIVTQVFGALNQERLDKVIAALTSLHD